MHVRYETDSIKRTLLKLYSQVTKLNYLLLCFQFLTITREKNKLQAQWLVGSIKAQHEQ